MPKGSLDLQVPQALKASLDLLVLIQPLLALPVLQGRLVLPVPWLVRRVQQAQPARLPVRLDLLDRLVLKASLDQQVRLVLTQPWPVLPVLHQPSLVRLVLLVLRVLKVSLDLLVPPGLPLLWLVRRVLLVPKALLGLLVPPGLKVLTLQSRDLQVRQVPHQRSQARRVPRVHKA